MLAALICRLEQCADAMLLESTYRPSLERAIAELMHAVYWTTDPSEKMMLTGLEYRARMVRERWVKKPQN